MKMVSSQKDQKYVLISYAVKDNKNFCKSMFQVVDVIDQ